MTPTEFTPGKTYIYDYSARLLTGIPKISEQYSAFVMNAEVILQARSASEIGLKLKDIKSAQMDRLLGSELEQDKEMLQRWTKEYLRELEKAITFTHVNGQVVNFMADKTEPEWSINIKKSILSLFNLNLTPKEVLRVPQGNLVPKPVSNEDLTYYGVYEQGMGGVCETTYEVNQIPEEMNPLAERDFVLNVTKTKNYNNCLSRPTLMKENYSLRHQEVHHEEKMSAVKGYYPVPEPTESKHHQQHQEDFYTRQEKEVKQYNHVKYNISMTSAKAVIEGVWSEGKIIYSSFGDKIMAITQQNLTLTKITSSRSVAMVAVSNGKLHEQLSYRLPKMSLTPQEAARYSSALGQQHYQMDIPHMILYGKPNVEELTQKLPKIFESLAREILSIEKSNDDETHKHSMQRVVEIVNTIASLPKDALQALHGEIAQQGREQNASPKAQTIRKMFLDALALCGTNDAALLIKDMIIDGRVSTSEARELLETLPHNMYLPDVKTVDAFLELAQHPRVINRPLLQTAASIAFGKLVNFGYLKVKATPGDLPLKYRKSMDERQEIQGLTQQEREIRENLEHQDSRWENMFPQQLLTKEDIERYVAVAARLLEEADTFTKKVTAIETLAHMGVPQVLAILEPYVSGSASLNVVPGYQIEEGSNIMKERSFLRTIAIYSLAHVAKRYPHQVLPLVLPVYRNVNEAHQTRLAAFTITMLSTPEAHILESIATDLHKEQDKQVVHFVVSALKSIGNNTTPCMKKVAKAAAEAVAAAPEERKSSKYSKYVSKSFFDEMRDFGMWGTAEVIQSKRSPVPKAGYVSLVQTTGNFHEQLLEIGFEAKGLEKVVRRIVGRNGLIASILEEGSYSPLERNQRRQQREQLTQQRNKISVDEAVQQLRTRLATSLNMDPSMESAKLNLFVKMFERTSIYALDESMMYELIDQAESTIQNWAQELVNGYTGTFVKVFMPSSLQKVVPSEMGLPVIVSHKHPMVFSLKVNSAEMKKKTHGFEIKADVEPKWLYSSYTFVFGVLPVQKTAVGTHVDKTTQASLPLKIKINYNRPEAKWTVDLKPRVNHEALYHKTEAKTFISKVKIANSPSRDWLETAQSIRSKQSSTVKTEKRVAHPEIPVAAKISMETEQNIQKRKTIEDKIAKKGLIQTMVEIFRNPGLNQRELKVKIESREGEEAKIQFEWSMKKFMQRQEQEEEENRRRQGNQQVDQEDRNSSEEQDQEDRDQYFQRRQDQQMKHQHDQHNHEDGASSEEKDYHFEEPRHEFLGEIFSRVSSALRRGDQEEISRVNQKMQRKAGQWLQKARNSMSWALDSEEREQDSREDQFYPQSYKTMTRTHQPQNNQCHRMKTEFIIRDDKACFTTRPILSCGASCQPQETKEVEMDFHCLPRSSPFTQNLMNQAETQVLKQLVNKRVDFRDSLTVPLACVA